LSRGSADAKQGETAVDDDEEPRRWIRWLIAATAAAVLVVVVIVGGTFAYIHFISGKAPAPFSLRPTAGAASGSAQASGSAPAAGQSGGQGHSPAAAKPVAGTWQVAAGSQVGYRVKEVLFGQDNVAVGRTSAVAGQLTIRGTTVTAGNFTVQMATIKSDESQRDVQFKGRIMDTAVYPTGKLTLTSPIRLAPLPAVGAGRTYAAHGSLTLHGQSRPVAFRLTADRTPTRIEASGSIPVRFSNWGIPNPSFGPVSTEKNGQLEFLLTLRKM
jgi:polyisoprenoid-binding protein YceI